MEKTATKNASYSKSITNLYTNIKDILVEKVKEKDSNYTYKTIGELKDKAILYLPTEMQGYAIALYSLVMYPKDEVFEYNALLNIYNDLK